MSTRCQIIVEGCSAVLYRHSDGYPDGPSGVLADLLPLVKRFRAVRGDDPDYLCAQILHGMVAAHHRWANKAKKDWAKRGDKFSEECRYIGYGVEALEGGLHGDLEYLYIVKSDHVEVRGVNRLFWDSPGLHNTRVEKCVRFNGKTYQGAALVAAPCNNHLT